MRSDDVIRGAHLPLQQFMQRRRQRGR